MANANARSPGQKCASATAWANWLPATPKAITNVRSKNSSSGVAVRCFSWGSRPPMRDSAWRRGFVDMGQRLPVHLLPRRDRGRTSEIAGALQRSRRVPALSPIEPLHAAQHIDVFEELLVPLVAPRRAGIGDGVEVVLR